jgi:O-antigen/teichoic acid export membrane protein
MKNDKGNILMKKSTNQIKSAVIISYITIAFSVIIGIVYTPWMIRQIGQSNYGLYTLAITLISFFTIDFGLGEAVSRFLSRYLAENQNNKISDFLGITFKLYILIDMVIVIVVLVVNHYLEVIYAELTPNEMEMFRYIFILVALYAIASFPFQPLNGILIANEKFVFYKLIDLFNKIFTTITMVIVLILGYKVYALVIVNVAVGIFIVLAKLFYVVSNKIIQINFKARNKTILKDILKYTFWTAMKWWHKDLFLILCLQF